MFKEILTLSNRLIYVANKDMMVGMRAVTDSGIDTAVDNLFKYMNDRYTFSNSDEFIKIIRTIFLDPKSEYILAFEQGLKEIAADPLATEQSFTLFNLMNDQRKYSNDLITIIAARYLMHHAVNPSIDHSVFTTNEFDIFIARTSYVVLEASSVDTSE